MNQYKPKSISDFPRLDDVIDICKSNRTRLPYVVEFTGLPKAGKTTILRRTKRALQQLGLKCVTVSEAATTKIDDCYRSDLVLFNFICLFENIKCVLMESHRRDTTDVVLVDRGVYDSLVWIDWLTKSDSLPDIYKSTMLNIVKLNYLFSKTDLVVYINSNWKSYCTRFLLDSPVEQDPKMEEHNFDLLRESYKSAYASSKDYSGLMEVEEYDGELSDVSMNSRNPASHQVLLENWNTANELSINIVEKIMQNIIRSNVEYVASIRAANFKSEVILSLEKNDLSSIIKDYFSRDEDGKPVKKKPYDPPPAEYIQRDLVEKDSNYIQIVAGSFIRRHQEYMVLKHASTEKREQLRGRLSIIVSGHVEQSDSVLSEGETNAVKHCLYREIKEELDNILIYSAEPYMAIRTGDDIMGKRHLGIIYETVTFSDNIRVSDLPGAGAFESDLVWLNFDQLSERCSEFSEWSQQIINRMEKQNGSDDEI